MILKDEPSRSEDVQYATGEEWRTNTDSSGKKCLGQTGKDTQLWMCLVMKVKSDAVKNRLLDSVGEGEGGMI